MFAISKDRFLIINDTQQSAAWITLRTRARELEHCMENDLWTCTRNRKKKDDEPRVSIDSLCYKFIQKMYWKTI
jgi:hypothetical protein